MVGERNKVFVIAKKINAPFYKILGIDNIVIADGRESVLNKLRELSEQKDIAVIFVEESLLPEDRDIFLLNKKGLYPPIVAIPDSRSHLGKDPLIYYKRFATKLLGYEVKTV